MNSRSLVIRKASIVGILGNTLLSAAKITIGIISGSFAVISDGLDSASDVLTFVISFYASKIICRPPDYKYPYGYQRAEAIATKVLSFIIFFVGAQLFYTTLVRIIENQPHQVPSMIALYVTIISIVAKAALYIYNLRTGKRINSQMLIASGKNMRNDILISCSVLLGLFFTYQLNMPVLDLITGMAVSIWIMKEAFSIFMESNVELMDGVDDSKVYFKIFEAVEQTDNASHPHRVRLRKHGDQYVISLDIEVDPEMKVAHAHRIARQVEKNIAEKVGNTYDVMVHTEPLGNVEKEQFGLSRKKMENNGNQ
ncbi:MAG: cation diffusion facilitator family transporter [Bacteroidales bacterium]|nr:cation diffusion facilitator family transporter [Bacteroidales bacterium]